jgi:peptidoglycan hydrolase-like protein with peptidoglycan-binding domain
MKYLILAGASALGLALGGAGLAYAQGAGSTTGGTAGAGHTTASPQASSATAAASLSEEQIKQAQQKLKAEELYQGEIDGIAGPQTHDAIEAFQKKHGLKQTGSLDQETMNALGGGQTTGAGSSSPTATPETKKQ